MTICILISYVLTSFKEMSWPIKFIKGARPGLKRLAQVTSDSAINAETNIMKRRKGQNGFSMPNGVKVLVKI
jgi:hypothetical protein